MAINIDWSKIDLSDPTTLGTLGTMFGYLSSKDQDTETTRAPIFNEFLSDTLLGPLRDATLQQFNSPLNYKQVAPFSPDQIAAMGAIRGMAADPNLNGATATGANMIMGAFNGGAGNFTNNLINSVRPVNPGMIGTPQWSQRAAQDYMSPYLQNVRDTTLEQFDRNAGAQRARATAARAANRAFGTRGTLAAQDLEEDIARNRAATDAQLMEGGYRNAQQAFQADMARALQAASANQSAGMQAQSLDRSYLANLASLVQNQQRNAISGAQALQGLETTRRQGALRDIDALLRSGSLQQGQQQNIYDTNFFNAENVPWNRIQGALGVLSGAGTGFNQINPTVSPWQAALSGGLAGLGIAANLNKRDGGMVGYANGGRIGYAAGGLAGLEGIGQLEGGAYGGSDYMDEQMDFAGKMLVAPSQRGTRAADTQKQTFAMRVQAVKEALARGEITPSAAKQYISRLARMVEQGPGMDVPGQSAGTGPLQAAFNPQGQQEQRRKILEQMNANAAMAPDEAGPLQAALNPNNPVAQQRRDTLEKMRARDTMAPDEPGVGPRNAMPVPPPAMPPAKPTNPAAAGATQVAQRNPAAMALAPDEAGAGPRNAMPVPQGALQAASQKLNTNAGDSMAMALDPHDQYMKRIEEMTQELRAKGKNSSLGDTLLRVAAAAGRPGGLGQNLSGMATAAQEGLAARRDSMNKYEQAANQLELAGLKGASDRDLAIRKMNQELDLKRLDMDAWVPLSQEVAKKRGYDIRSDRGYMINLKTGEVKPLDKESLVDLSNFMGKGGDPRDLAFGEKYYPAMGQVAADIVKAGSEAGGIKNIADMGLAMLDGGIDTGFGQKQLLPFKQLLAGIGVDVEGVGAQELFSSLGQRLLPYLRAEGSGALSNFETMALFNSSATLQSTPEGNRAILLSLKREAELKQQKARAVDRYVSENGRYDSGFDDWYAQNYDTEFVNEPLKKALDRALSLPQAMGRFYDMDLDELEMVDPKSLPEDELYQWRLRVDSLR